MSAGNSRREVSCRYARRSPASDLSVTACGNSLQCPAMSRTVVLHTVACSDSGYRLLNAGWLPSLHGFGHPTYPLVAEFCSSVKPLKVVTVTPAVPTVRCASCVNRAAAKGSLPRDADAMHAVTTAVTSALVARSILTIVVLRSSRGKIYNKALLLIFLAHSAVLRYAWDGACASPPHSSRVRLVLVLNTPTNELDRPGSGAQPGSLDRD